MVKTGTQVQDSRMFSYVLMALAMSGYDAVATMQHIGRGVALEGNPLMDSLIQRNAILFFLVKMTATALGLMICYSNSHLRTARLGIRVVFALYSVVCVYHVLIVFLG
ncbi:MAG TPA: DUF5658 family protein [Blastocatellia bacterium]|nr:DUF5658 family protein [Blastocatellia bacterium]